MEPPFPDRSRLLPLPHERVASVNIFLLTGLGWAARMLYLVAGATRSDMDFGTETALAQVRVLYGPRDLNLLLGASALGLVLLVETGAMVVRRERSTAPVSAVRCSRTAAIYPLLLDE